MEAVAHSPEFAKKAGVPQSVGKDFAAADKGLKFRKGGTTNPMKAGINKPQTHHGIMQMPNVSLQKYTGMKKGGIMESKKEMREEMKADKAQDVSLIKKAFKQHDSQEHKGSKGTTLKLAGGGSFRSSANGIAKKGLTKGTIVKMCGGGKAKK